MKAEYPYHWTIWDLKASPGIEPELQASKAHVLTIRRRRLNKKNRAPIIPPARFELAKRMQCILSAPPLTAREQWIFLTGLPI